MLTFLGHGSATIIDVEFGTLGEINNPNKYPFFYFNGCNIGNPSEIDPEIPVALYGKDFVCASNKGAIGWLAHSNLTLDNKLYGQMDSYYTQFCGASYAKLVGDILVIAQQKCVDRRYFYEIALPAAHLAGRPGNENIQPGTA